MKPRELLRGCVIVAMVALAAATPAGDFWWMGKDNAFGGSGGQKAHNGQKKHSGQNGNSGQNDYSENNQVGQNLPQRDQFAGAGNQLVNDYPQQVVETEEVRCPGQLRCVPHSQCRQNKGFQAIQERISNPELCGNGKICCEDNPIVVIQTKPPSIPKSQTKPKFALLSRTESSQALSLNTEDSPLPVTECPYSMKCVKESLCDISGTIQTDDQKQWLTKQQKKQRGKLIPCMNQVTGQFEICCKRPKLSALTVNPTPVSQGAASLPAVQGLPVTQGLPATQGLTSSSSSSGSCPAITSIPPVEECSGRSSNCWSVGQPDVDCVDDALCCFDGCANVCQGGGAITGNATPATNARGQVVKNSPNIPQNVQAATQLQNIPQATQEAVILPKDTSTGQTVPVASEVLINVASPNKEDFESSQGVAIPPTPKQQKPKRRGYGGGSAQQSSSQTRNEQKIVFPVESDDNQGGSITPVQPPNPRPQQVAQAASARKPQPAPARKPKPAPARKPQPAPVRKPQPAPVRKQKPAPARKPQPAPARKPKPAPRKPQPAPVRKPQPVRNPKPAPVRKPEPAPVRKPQPIEASSNNFQQSQAASRPVAPAELKPYVTCPSAMKCVERPFCDFNGVMTDQPLNNLTPQLEMLRVPLIPCVNRQRDNNVDVCCRDPNYKDPWPDMNGNNANNGKNVNNGLNGNNANNAIDNGNGAFQDQPVIQNNQRQTQNSVGHNNKTKNKKKNNRKNYG